MAQGQFIVSDTNPNNSVGGGGCICDQEQQTDCQPPFIVISQNTMDSPISPYPVACAKCVGEWHKALGGEALRTDNPDDAPGTNWEAQDDYRDHQQAFREALTLRDQTRLADEARRDVPDAEDDRPEI